MYRFLSYMGEGSVERPGPVCGKVEVLASDVVPSTRLTMFDVGHGDCLLVEVNGEELLVDCGSRSPAKYTQVPTYIKNDHLSFVLCHYHSDHYNLSPHLSSRSGFRTVYVPALPIAKPLLPISLFICNFLSLATLAFHRYFPALPFLMNQRRVVPLEKGQPLREAGIEWQVLWPDFADLPFFRRIVSVAQRATEEINALIEHLTHEQKHAFETLSSSLFRSLKQGEESFVYDQEARQLAPLELPAESRRRLESLEDTFHTVADTLTLVFASDIAAFFGDADQRVLDIVEPLERTPLIVKASHHGTRFGECLQRMDATVLMISRGSSTGRLHPSYLNAMRPKLTLRTDIHGTCQCALH